MIMNRLYAWQSEFGFLWLRNAERAGAAGNAAVAAWHKLCKNRKCAHCPTRFKQNNPAHEYCERCSRSLFL